MNATFMLKIRRRTFAVLFGWGSAVGLLLGLHAAEPAQRSGEWTPLFDGKTLSGWTATDFAGKSDPTVQDGTIVVPMPIILGGVHYTNPVPKINYEVSLDAIKTEGSDFFCGLTAPLNDSAFTLIVGGWGGSVVGISSIDSMDASENEATKFMNFDKDRWYNIRLRVTEAKIEAWIDDEKIVDQLIVGRQVAMRPGEIEISQPLGLATYQTAAAYKNIQVRRIVPPKRIALIAGRKSHGPGEHEYEKGMHALKYSLEKASNVSRPDIQIYRNGWPYESSELAASDAIVLFCDGSDHDEKDHPLLRYDRMDELAAHIKKGGGFIAIHYTVFVPSGPAGESFLDWIGGYFDYQNGTGPRGWHSKIETREFAVKPVSTHPITRGVEPFTIKEEFYFNMRFREPDPRRTLILGFGENPAAPENAVAWAVERPDGGRGFGYTGGHFHVNWADPNVRRMMLNAILWTAKAEVPSEGVQSPVAPNAAD